MVISWGLGLIVLDVVMMIMGIGLCLLNKG